MQLQHVEILELLKVLLTKKPVAQRPWLFCHNGDASLAICFCFCCSLQAQASSVFVENEDVPREIYQGEKQATGKGSITGFFNLDKGRLESR